MTTALTIIEDALGEIGVKEHGQSLSSEDSAIGLRYLNRILERWSNHRLLIPALTEISVPLSGAYSYTIGPTGAVVVTRPNKIIGAYSRDSAGIDTPIQVLSEVEWQVINDKSLSGPPDRVWYEKTNTNGTLHVYPDTSGYTLKLQCQVLLSSFALNSTSLTLPEGYESALMLTLAVDLAGRYEKQVSRDLAMRSAAANRSVKRTNYEPLLMNVAESADYDINRGY